MNNKPEILNKMLGQSFCYAEIGYSGAFKIGLGNRIFYDHPRLSHLFHGEWDIITISSAWRIIKDEKIICGSYDFLEENESKFNTLVFGILLNINCTPPYGLALSFSSGIRIEYWNQSATDNSLEILAPNNTYLELDHKGIWKESCSNIPAECLTEEEKRFVKHTEECHTRWSKSLSQCEMDECCSNCAFYCPLSGHFYFWDYGLCSNTNSNYDGKVVGVKHTCFEFNKLS